MVHDYKRVLYDLMRGRIAPCDRLCRTISCTDHGHVIGRGQSNGGRMVLLQWRPCVQLYGACAHVREVASIMEGEWSCFTLGAFYTH